MTGLDKILNHIEEDAKSSADKLIEDARHQAEAILAEAERQPRQQPVTLKPRAVLPHKCKKREGSSPSARS